MKLFVLLSRFPYPLEKGDKLRAFHQIKALSKSHEILLCCLSDKPINAEALEKLAPFCAEIHIIRLSKFKILWRLLTGLFSRRPFQYHYFYDKSAQKQINFLIEKFLPKHIYCQLIRTGSYVKKYSVIHKTLDYMDALSAGMYRRAGVSKFPLNFLFKIEARRLEHFEAELFSYFKHHCIISEQDRQAIKHPRNMDIKVIANGISDTFFEDLQRETKYDVVFAGNMNYPPNILAATFLIEKVLPIINRNLKVLIAGANPSSKVKNLASQNVHVSGWMDDIREAYAQSRVFVAPMFIGSGLQNKLLEAMAQGLACVTSPLANNALGAKNGEEVLIAETPEEFADKILLLSTNHDEANRIGRKAKEFVRKNYAWERQTRSLTDLFETE